MQLYELENYTLWSELGFKAAFQNLASDQLLVQKLISEQRLEAIVDGAKL